MIVFVAMVVLLLPWWCCCCHGGAAVAMVVLLLWWCCCLLCCCCLRDDADSIFAADPGSEKGTQVSPQGGGARACETEVVWKDLRIQSLLLSII